MLKSALFGTLFFLTLAFGSTPGIAQEDETYDFDGVADVDPQPDDPTDWMTSVNWSDGGADPFPPFGPEVPDLGTRVEIQTSMFGVDAPEIGPGDEAEAFEIRIGRFAGAGLLTMSGGTLTTADSCNELPFSCNRRFRIGAANVALPGNQNPGTFNISDGTVETDTLWIGSGSQGLMNMTGGEVNTRGDLSLDWTIGADSMLTMSAGTINIGTSALAPNRALRMYRNSVLNLDGGEILIQGDAELGLVSSSNSAGGVESADVTVAITDGLLQADDSLIVNGSVTLDGGILRAGSFGETNSSGTIEVNAGGLLQFENAQESVAAVDLLIAGGIITTSEADPLTVEIVNVGGTDFTQVSAAAAGLAGDFDGDGDVDGADFLAWQRGFPGSFDADDLTDWQNSYGPGPSASAAQAVPEPGSLALLLIAVAAWTHERRGLRGDALRLN